MALAARPASSTSASCALVSLSDRNTRKAFWLAHVPLGLAQRDPRSRPAVVSGSEMENSDGQAPQIHIPQTTPGCRRQDRPAADPMDRADRRVRRLVAVSPSADLVSQSFCSADSPTITEERQNRSACRDCDAALTNGSCQSAVRLFDVAGANRLAQTQRHPPRRGTATQTRPTRVGSAVCQSAALAIGSSNARLSYSDRPSSVASTTPSRQSLLVDHAIRERFLGGRACWLANVRAISI